MKVKLNVTSRVTEKVMPINGIELKLDEKIVFIACHQDLDIEIKRLEQTLIKKYQSKYIFERPMKITVNVPENCNIDLLPSQYFYAVRKTL